MTEDENADLSEALGVTPGYPPNASPSTFQTKTETATRSAIRGDGSWKLWSCWAKSTAGPRPCRRVREFGETKQAMLFGNTRYWSIRTSFPTHSSPALLAYASSCHRMGRETIKARSAVEFDGRFLSHPPLRSLIRSRHYDGYQAFITQDPWQNSRYGQGAARV